MAWPLKKQKEVDGRKVEIDFAGEEGLLPSHGHHRFSSLSFLVVPFKEKPEHIRKCWPLLPKKLLRDGRDDEEEYSERLTKLTLLLPPSSSLFAYAIPSSHFRISVYISTSHLKTPRE